MLPAAPSSPRAFPEPLPPLGTARAPRGGLHGGAGGSPAEGCSPGTGVPRLRNGAVSSSPPTPPCRAHPDLVRVRLLVTRGWGSRRALIAPLGRYCPLARVYLLEKCPQGQLWRKCLIVRVTCMDSRDPSLGQSDSPAALPITVRLLGSSASSAAPARPPPPLSAEEFHLLNPNGQPLCELQPLGAPSAHMMIVASQSENGQVLHVIPSAQPGMAQVIIPQGQLLDVTSTQDASEEKCGDGNLQTVAVAAIADSASGYILHPQASLSISKKSAARILQDSFPMPLQSLPTNAPAWARRLWNCEKIGDSYRGYCVSETELESVLTLHKQQTQSVWGTRQSPSPAKPATRLMWKSQYVPYDGIPFINAGSRAIVMECQYGPRRKGFQSKKAGEQESTSGYLYKATCPARWYVQLPTQQAHQYHEMETSCLPSSPSHFPAAFPEEEEEVVRDENCTLPSRLHPQVADKIRELVSQGIEQVYAVRKQLRKYVERELFKPDEVPERHNLSFFPTVNDIKNHIHEVQKSLRNGELVYNSESIPATLQWTTDSGNVLTETVTVTFASPPSDGSSPGESVITKAESNQSGETLLSERAQLLSSLSSLQPKIFAQLQGLQLQSNFTSTNGSTALIAVNNHSHPNSASLLDSIGSAVTNHSPVLGQGHNPQKGAGLAQHSASAFGTPPGTDQNVVTVGQLVALDGDSRSLEGEVQQILLGNVQTIPVRIVESQPALIEDNTEAGICMSEVKQEPREKALSVEPDKIRDCQRSSSV
ncbi:calcium-responsive transcription factor isoform X4 [Numida meleagris]|uniref:calcium-responsive transcription factor isoform X4 n=1 Tax=Numida meleagris TaxID=8996 RepID=UPI000B3E3439|nr:calcium-responsive transcription factor isoform X4 [Numida meleagris]